MRHWPTVSIGEVLHKSQDWIALDPNTRYKEVTVRLWGNGVVLRREASGAEIAAKSRLRVHKSQFIMSRIDARNGAFGLVPEDLEGAIVSNDFPVFSPDMRQLVPSFLHWMSKTQIFVDICKAASEGTTNRVRLKEERFLDMKISLPPLDQQQQIVDRIDAVAAKIDMASRFILELNEDLANLCRAILHNTSYGDPVPTPMSELVTLRQPDVTVSTDQTYHFAGVYCFGGGLFVGQKKSGLEFAYPRLTQLRTGNFVYPKLMAWEGALAVVPAECNGLVVSTEFPVFDINEQKVFPEVLDVYFRSPATWPALSGSSTGTNVRRRRLNPADFLNHRMPLPNRHVQETLRQANRRVHQIREQHNTSTKELTAMLPATLARAFRGEL